MLSNHGHSYREVANAESQGSRDITIAHLRNSMDIINLYESLGTLDNHYCGTTLAFSSNRGTNAGLTEAENAAAELLGMHAS